MDLSVYRRFLIELAQQSGDFIVPHFARPDLTVEFKSDKSPVTIADRGAEQLMRELIGARFPDHGIIGEEFGQLNPDREFVWVLDPVDGTNSFASGSPLFGTLIALLHRGKPVLGGIHQPVLKQLVIGDGQTTELNGVPVKIRPCSAISDAILLTTDIQNIAKHQDWPRFKTLADQARLFRTWGDCYGYLLLATGWADGMCDPIMNPWDIAALVPVIQGAGGIITDWAGNDPMQGTSILAAGADVHAELLRSLSR